jgi:hypothetical protein
LNINRDKTLEEIENYYWNDISFETDLIEKCYAYRKIPIKSMSTENIRLLLGQNIGNKVLIPEAIEKLKENILEDGDLFEGDLLVSVLRSERSYWIQKSDQYEMMKKILESNESIFAESDPGDIIFKDIMSLIKEFKEIM